MEGASAGMREVVGRAQKAMYSCIGKAESMFNCMGRAAGGLEFLDTLRLTELADSQAYVQNHHQKRQVPVRFRAHDYSFLITALGRSGRRRRGPTELSRGCMHSGLLSGTWPGRTWSQCDHVPILH